jgi:hypothetical protein
MCIFFFFDWGQSHTYTQTDTAERESRREPKNGASLSCVKGRASMKGAHSRSSRMGIAGAALGTTRGRPGPRSLSVRETCCLSRAQVDLVVLVLRDEPWRFFCAHVRARRVLVKATQHQPKQKVKKKKKEKRFFVLPWRSSPRRRRSAGVSKLPEAGARGLHNSNRERGRYM